MRKATARPCVSGLFTANEGIGVTGVVGILRGTGGAGRTIGLRADMDALPMEEQTNLPYRSQNPGAFHGCGHDGHTTMLLKRIEGRDAASAIASASARSFGGRTIHWIVVLSASLWRLTKGFT
ncbi:hippurate hydrolase [Aurantimonas sp. 22II-16-19i]|nr:hippurate hydrolase [Aurantimonas sp. 22II-16-19i]